MSITFEQAKAVLATGTLSINQRDDASAGSITVKTYTPGQLGLSLQGAKVPGATNNLLNGDFGKLEVNGSLLRLGDEYATNGNSAPGAADLITGGAAAETISGLGGNDFLRGMDGDDYVSGGDGDDTLYGDDADANRTPTDVHGNDRLDGGAGNYVMLGGGRDDCDRWSRWTTPKSIATRACCIRAIDRFHLETQARNSTNQEMQ